MSYYDNVKDNVKDKKSDASGKPSFDTLKEEAEKTSVEDEEEAEDDGTPIEVLEEGGLNKKSAGSSSKSDRGSKNTAQKKEKGATEQNKESRKPVNETHQEAEIDLSSVEDKLDTLIDQNRRIIEVLESFGQ